MITVSDLVFEYRTTRVLHDITFHIEADTVTALVGPNGAGKTTLLRCLAALDTPFSGRIRIAGHDTIDEPRQCHRQIGYLSDFFGLYEALTVRQSLTYMALAHHLPATDIESRVSSVADSLDLSDRLDMLTGELSRGLRQRVAIGKAIIHRPRVLLLDEPASGLDPEARYQLAGLFQQLRGKGMTILVSSHILAELEEYSTHMLVLRDGFIRAHQSLHSSWATGSNTVALKLRCAHSVPELPAWLRQHGAEAVTPGNDTVDFRFEAGTDARQSLLRGLLDAGFPVLELTEQRQNLQDIYLADAEQA